MSLADDVKLVFRAVSGHALSGEEKTDARWSKPGTQVVGGTRRAGRWSFWSHRRRAGVRAVGALAPLVAIVVVVVDPGAAVVVGRMLFWLVVLPGGCWAQWEWSRRYAHRRDVVVPLAEALSARLNDARYTLDPATWLHVPVDVLDRPTRVYLPVGYDPTEAQVKSLVSLVARRIGLVGPSHVLDLKGEAPYLELVPAPAPREVVGYSDPDVRALVAKAVEGRPLLGLGPRDLAVDVDLDADSPHVGLSVATGGGKSVLARALAAQVLHHGGIVLVLDRKIESQLWAVDLPGVRYACSEAEIYQALMDVSGEIDRRFELVRARRFAGEPLEREEIGPRLLVVAEEVNALEIDLRIWWRSVREPGDPAQCPALPILGRILAMGRAGRVHMIVIAQKLTCQAIGGPAARENLSTRILGRATTSTWNMLAPECKVGGKYPRSSRVRGRVHVVVGDEATPTQVMFIGEDDARALAMSGTVATFPDMREVGLATALPGATPALEAPHLAAVPDPDQADDELEGEPLVTLAEYASEIGVPPKTLQNARDRGALEDPVESGRGKPSKYRRAALEAWREERSAGVGGGAA